MHEFVDLPYSRLATGAIRVKRFVSVGRAWPAGMGKEEPSKRSESMSSK